MPGPVVIKTRQGRYEVVRLLATGGMAEIFLATHALPSGARRTVVLKRILPNLRSEREFVDLFMTEGRLATQLDHPNIVRVYEVGDEPGETGPFMTMEYLEGADVRSLLREVWKRGAKLGVAEAVAVIAQAARGLAYAHDRLGLDGRPLNIVHRDISPHNLFVTFDGVAKVLDFGIAKSTQQLSVTRGNMMKGKMGYMAPEQVRGVPIDRRADVFALGIVLWETLTTERLYLRDNDAAILFAVLNQRPKPPSAFNPDVPRSLDAVVLRMLAVDPSRRFQRAGDVADALDRVLGELGVARPEATLAARVRELLPEYAPGTGPVPSQSTRAISIAGVPTPEPDDGEPVFDVVPEGVMEEMDTTSLAGPAPDDDAELEPPSAPPSRWPDETTRPRAEVTATAIELIDDGPTSERSLAQHAGASSRHDAVPPPVAPLLVAWPEASSPPVAPSQHPPVGAVAWERTEPVPRQPARLVALLGAIVAAGVVLGGAVFALGRASRARGPEAPLGAAATRASVRLRITGAPTGATARLDGDPIALDVAVPRASRPRRLELLAGGRVISTANVVADRDVIVAFPPLPPPRVVEPAPPSAPPAPVVAPLVTPPAPVVTPPAAPRLAHAPRATSSGTTAAQPPHARPRGLSHEADNAYP